MFKYLRNSSGRFPPPPRYFLGTPSLPNIWKASELCLRPVVTDRTMTVTPLRCPSRQLAGHTETALNVTGPKQGCTGVTFFNERVPHSVLLPELRRDGPVPAPNSEGLRAHRRATAHWIFFQSDSQVLQRLAPPRSLQALLPGVPTGSLAESPEWARARDYFVTSLRGGERGGEKPGGRSAAGTSAATGHLRGA